MEFRKPKTKEYICDECENKAVNLTAESDGSITALCKEHEIVPTWLKKVRTQHARLGGYAKGEDGRVSIFKDGS